MCQRYRSRSRSIVGRVLRETKTLPDVYTVRKKLPRKTCVKNTSTPRSASNFRSVPLVCARHHDQKPEYYRRSAPSPVCFRGNNLNKHKATNTNADFKKHGAADSVGCFTIRLSSSSSVRRYSSTTSPTGRRRLLGIRKATSRAMSH